MKEVSQTLKKNITEKLFNLLFVKKKKDPESSTIKNKIISQNNSLIEELVALDKDCYDIEANKDILIIKQERQASLDDLQAVLNQPSILVQETTIRESNSNQVLLVFSVNINKSCFNAKRVPFNEIFLHAN